MKLARGMRLRPQAYKGTRKAQAAAGEWDGVVVYFIPPTADNHGVVATWLEEQVNYGGDNCEHYAYESEEDLDALFTVLD